MAITDRPCPCGTPSRFASPEHCRRPQRHEHGAQPQSIAEHVVHRVMARRGDGQTLRREQRAAG
ncbi:MAG TPA: hypothetical protein VN153_00350, partial [Tahibacter sp.]|nr:hypothetical protein [Tahibacter sp.]